MVIRCPDSNNTNTTTGGTALPKFAIRGMLKTFGLHGVVLDVDSVSTTTILACVERNWRMVAVLMVSCYVVYLVGLELLLLSPINTKTKRNQK